MADEDDLATREQLDMSGRQFAPLDQVKPGFWSGFGHFGMNEAQTGYDVGPMTPLATGIDHGLLSGVATYEAIQAATAHRENPDVRAMSPFWRPPQTDEEAAARAAQHSQELQALAKKLSPDPQTTGGAYRLVHSLADFATKLTLGAPAGPGGMFVSAGGISAFEGYHAALDQGVDEDTAERMGGVEGVTAGLFGLVPGAGSLLKEGASQGARLLFETGLGVGANTSLGAFNRYADHRILENAGYPDLAAQYATFDGSAMFADAVTGLLPAGMHLAGSAARRALGFAAAAGRRDGLVQDAVDTVNLARANAAAAPGIPVGEGSAVAHDEAMATARGQVMNGEPVDLSGTRMAESGASFVTRGRDPASMDEAVALFAEHMKEAGATDQLSALTGMDLQYAARAGIPIDTPPEPFTPHPYEGLSPTDRETAERQDEAARGQVIPPEQSVGDRRTALEEKNSPKRKAPHALIPNARTDSIIQFMAKHKRGLDIEAFGKEGLDRPDMNAQRFGIRRAFRKGGVGLDEATEILRESGYLHGEVGQYQYPLLEALAREMSGNKQYSLEADLDTIEGRRAAAIEQAAQEIPEIREMPAQDAEASLIAERMIRDGKEDEAETFSTRYEYGTSEEKETLLEQHREKGNVKEKGDGHGKTPGEFTLKSESESERASRERASSERTVAEQQSILSATERAGADRQRDQFTLTGSDRTSDANPNQADILAKQILVDRPDLKIVDADGQPVDAAAAAEQAKALEDQAAVEAKKALDAAKDCFLRGSE